MAKATGNTGHTQVTPAPWEQNATESSPPQEDDTTAAESNELVEAATGELVEMVTVIVPKAYKLRLDNFREMVVPAGVQEMELAHAEHWYSKANGVTIYSK